MGMRVNLNAENSEISGLLPPHEKIRSTEKKEITNE
jgi:hypothetical protein